MPNEEYLGFDRDLLIATHESGHAVVCHVLGYDFESISIEKDKVTGADGYFKRSLTKEPLEYGSRDEKGKKFWMLDKIKMTLSGGLAVLKLTNNVDTTGMKPDHKSARSFELQLVNNDETKAKELDAALGSMAKDLIENERNWAAITALADKLIKRRTIEYQDALTIINKAFSDYDSGKQ